jgi:hypothetical protein
MIEQTSSIVISIGARSCALRFRADTSPKFVGMFQLPADQSIDRGHSRSCDPCHTKWHCETPSPRHFPAPWSTELQPNYYVVRDADGQQLAYVYYSNDPERRSAAKLLTKDEARRIAANIA